SARFDLITFEQWTQVQCGSQLAVHEREDAEVSWVDVPRDGTGLQFAEFFDFGARLGQLVPQLFELFDFGRKLVSARAAFVRDYCCEGIEQEAVFAEGGDDAGIGAGIDVFVASALPAGGVKSRPCVPAPGHWLRLPTFVCLSPARDRRLVRFD